MIPRGLLEPYSLFLIFSLPLLWLIIGYYPPVRKSRRAPVLLFSFYALAALLLVLAVDPPLNGVSVTLQQVPVTDRFALMEYEKGDPDAVSGTQRYKPGGSKDTILRFPIRGQAVPPSRLVLDMGTAPTDYRITELSYDTVIGLWHLPLLRARGKAVKKFIVLDPSKFAHRSDETGLLIHPRTWRSTSVLLDHHLERIAAEASHKRLALARGIWYGLLLAAGAAVLFVPRMRLLLGRAAPAARRFLLS